MIKLNNNDFLEKSIKIHNNEILYLDEYINSYTKIKMKCKKCGLEFKMTPNNHISKKQGCPFCNRKFTSKEEYIKKSNFIHNNKYNYDNLPEIISKNKIDITCPIHGSFNQRPDIHLSVCGCPKCGKQQTKYQFIQKSNIKFNNYFDYSLVEYVNSKTKVKIICPIHGIFEQTPNNHLKSLGCQKCVFEKSIKSKNDFINDCYKKKLNIYDYSLVEYINSKTKVKIICSIHGIFEQTPDNHLNKDENCPICNSSKGELQIANILMYNNINFIKEKKFKNCKDIRLLPFDFYLPNYNLCIEYDGIQHYKSIEYFGGLKNHLETKKRDIIKNNFCESNNIQLIRIKYDEKDIELKLLNILIYNKNTQK